jgi:hypothetical protein
MKVFSTALALLFLFNSCNENGVSPSKSATFVRYFNDGNQDDAVDIIQTSDKGFLILSHSVNASKGYGWITLTKTDLNGNTIGDIKPIVSSSNRSDLRPSNLVAIKDNSGNDTGYLIVGTLQNPSFGARLFVAKTDVNGAIQNAIDSVSYYTKTFGYDSTFRKKSGGYVMGKGVTQSTKTNNIFVVGQVVKADLTTSYDSAGQAADMFFAGIDGTTLKMLFSRTYGAGTSMLASRLYLDFNQTSAYWGGTRSDASGTHMRLINSGFNSRGTNFDLPYPTGDSGYTGNDFCAYGYGYAFIGNHSVPSKPQKISLARVGNGGNLVDTLANFSLQSGLDLAGNSVCSALDGGLLLLGTSTVDSQGTNTDYYLIKVDGNGAKQWEIAHGGKYPDVGVRVLQSIDGGYVVLGTTTLANVKTVFLMKTDSRGNIQ